MICSVCRKDSLVLEEKARLGFEMKMELNSLAAVADETMPSQGVCTLSEIKKAKRRYDHLRSSVDRSLAFLSSSFDLSKNVFHFSFSPLDKVSPAHV